MDKTFVVSFVDIPIRQLTCEVIKAKTVGEAVCKHSKINRNRFEIYHSINYIKNVLYNKRCLVEVTEIG